MRVCGGLLVVFLGLIALCLVLMPKKVWEREQVHQRQRGLTKEAAEKEARQKELGVFGGKLIKISVVLPARQEVDMFRGWKALRLQSGEVTEVNVSGLAGRRCEIFLQPQPDCPGFWVEPEGDGIVCFPHVPGRYTPPPSGIFKIKGQGTIWLQAVVQ